MSLSEALLEIADNMEAYVGRLSGKPLDSDGVYNLLVSYMGQIRVAVKAAAGNERQPIVAPLDTPEMQHFREIEKARRELREKRSGIVTEEAEPIMTPCRGGKSDGMVVARDAKMPDGVGAKMRVGSEIYELNKGELRFVGEPE